jgi:hypothetical protein
MSLTGFGVAGVAGLGAGDRFTLLVFLNRCSRASLLLISSADGVDKLEETEAICLIRLDIGRLFQIEEAKLVDANSIRCYYKIESHPLSPERFTRFLRDSQAL